MAEDDGRAIEQRLAGEPAQIVECRREFDQRRAERRQACGAKVIYNGLPPDDVPFDQLPRRSSFRHLWPWTLQEKVVENWKRYGYCEP